MAQSTPIRTNDTDDNAAALRWARIAGLVVVRPDGSWNLTPLGFAGMLALLGQAHPFDTPLAPPDRRHRYLG